MAKLSANGKELARFRKMVSYAGGAGDFVYEHSLREKGLTLRCLRKAKPVGGRQWGAWKHTGARYLISELPALIEQYVARGWERIA